jgi:hypothetical protein
MKKILLTIFIVFCIFQIVVAYSAIDIGEPAILRSSSYSTSVYTVVNIGNPANASGKITNVEFYCGGELDNVKVATFYVVSGNNLSTRDWELIGTVPSGYSEHIINLDVVAGDYIGFVASDSTLIRDDTSGGEGTWYSPKGLDWIPCTNQTFGVDVGWVISLYGTGTTAVGWPHKWNTKEISKWNAKEIMKWNELE